MTRRWVQRPYPNRQKVVLNSREFSGFQGSSLLLDLLEHGRGHQDEIVMHEMRLLKEKKLSRNMSSIVNWLKISSFSNYLVMVAHVLPLPCVNCDGQVATKVKMLKVRFQCGADEYEATCCRAQDKLAQLRE